MLARNRPEWVRGILDAMAWLGIGPDEYECPPVQSDYASHHADAIARILSADRVYNCDSNSSTTPVAPQA